jgi:acyl carrier protein
LYISGDGLARGYLNQPALTAERFIPNPFTSSAGARLYRSGDLGRYRPNGQIEFLGRIDQQVKVRGFRIELGEIESILLTHPDVKEAAVLVQTNGSSSKQIVAYVVARHEATVTTDGLRTFLNTKLPNYMVPSVVLQLQALPLTSSGKVDRQALTARDQEHSATTQEYVAPRTPTETLLVKIWAQVLDQPEGALSIYDNFFERGGHSLLATQMMFEVSERLHVQMALRSLFEAPTVAEFAERILEAQAMEPPYEMPTITSLDRNRHRIR